MADDHLASIATHFGQLSDPRVERTRVHNLLDILTIAICAVLAGADGPSSMETFGKAKEEWLRTILPLPNGIPSHDTFSRLLAHLKPAELQQGFLDWFAAIASATAGELAALDGKTLRKSAAKAWGQAAVQIVSAWASENRLVLGQQKVDPDSNEMTAVPALLESSLWPAVSSRWTRSTARSRPQRRLSRLRPTTSSRCLRCGCWCSKQVQPYHSGGRFVNHFMRLTRLHGHPIVRYDAETTRGETMPKGKPYSDEFKQEALKLVNEQNMRPRQVARDLGIDGDTLRRRLRAQERPPAEQASSSAAAELARLRRENDQLRMERDILKKARGSFSRMPQ